MTLKAILRRFESTEAGTFSTFTCERFQCYIVERPWKENRKNESCIPEGTYRVRWHKSPKFGWCYKVHNVPNRGDILFHSGNFYWHSHGCLLPATRLGYLDGKKAGLLSRPMVTKLNEFFGKKDFMLEIRDDYRNPYTTI